MRMGTKSLLFGAHQLLWHPFTVFLAWLYLYGCPSWKETICIFIHDWGYWGKNEMEGNLGIYHPELGASLAHRYLDDNGCWEYHDLCWLHSRTTSSLVNKQPSKLCWADKLSVKYERWWTYLPRVWLTGEWREYREEAAKSGVHPATTSDREWFEWAKERMIRKATNRDARPPYQVNS